MVTLAVRGRPEGAGGTLLGLVHGVLTVNSLGKKRDLCNFQYYIRVRFKVVHCVLFLK